MLSLKNPKGVVVVDYLEAPARYCVWHSYFHGFPKAEFSSKKSCIKDAKKMVGENDLIFTKYIIPESKN